MALSFPVNALVQTPTQFTAGGPAATGLKPQKRTFSLTGVMNTGIINGDAVGMWGSNDGGTTYQPLRAGNGQQVILSFNNPEAVIDDCCDHYATNRIAVGAGSTLAAVGMNGEAASNPLVQAGTGTLVNGTATISGVILTAASSIQVTMRDPGAGVLTTFIDFDVPVATRNVAAGTFVVNGIDNAKAVLATAQCTFDWEVVG